MYTSRCGINCDQCERKEEVHCTGCANMKTTFWGAECPVKSCCENKHLAHCGRCNEFPCTLVSTMGVDKGFDAAPRLANLQKWVEEEMIEA